MRGSVDAFPILEERPVLRPSKAKVEATPRTSIKDHIFATQTQVVPPRVKTGAKTVVGKLLAMEKEKVRMMKEYNDKYPLGDKTTGAKAETRKT